MSNRDQAIAEYQLSRIARFDELSVLDKGWDELYLAYNGDTYLDRDPITGVISYDHLGNQDVSDIPF